MGVGRERSVPSGPTPNAQHPTPSPVVALLDFWICGTALPHYELRAATARAEKEGYTVTLRVANRGTGTAPAPVVIQSEEGARHTLPVSVAPEVTIDVKYFVLTRPVQAAVDPDGEVLQEDGGRAWQPVRLRRWGIF